MAQLHAAREQIRELERAVESHRVVGQACGVLMALHRIDDRRAFAALQRVSMEHRVRLREVAEALRGLIASEVLVPESPAVRAAMLLLPGSSHPAAV